MTNRLLFLLAFGWLALITAGSALFRLNRGKPIFARPKADALFTERWASGGAGIGGANNCLMVSVSPSGLMVMPQFPMTLMFLPELYRLEFQLTPPAVKRVVQRKRWFGTRFHIERADGGRTFKLKLRKPESLFSAVEKIGVRTESD